MKWMHCVCLERQSVFAVPSSEVHQSSCERMSCSNIHIAFYFVGSSCKFLFVGVMIQSSTRSVHSHILSLFSFALQWGELIIRVGHILKKILLSSHFQEFTQVVNF